LIPDYVFLHDPTKETFLGFLTLQLKEALSMNPIPPTPGPIEKPLLFACLALVTFTGHCDKHKTSDRSVQVEEMRQRSVTEDPVVKGMFPFDWQANAQPAVEPPDELPEFTEIFKDTSAPKVVEGDLLPGATRVVELSLTGPAGLSGSAQWIGTDDALKFTISVNGSTLATGKTFKSGAKRGGSNVHAQTPVGGPATLALKNTSKAKVKIRILLLATAL
jgi:hypothetical protein